MKSFSLCLSLLLASAAFGASRQIVSGYRVGGVVIDALSHAPVPRAEVVLALENGEIKTLAGDDGRFAFRSVAAGKYPIFAGGRGYLREAYNQHGPFSTAIAVGNGLDSEHVILRLHREAVITGRVTDEHGEPVRHAQVTLFQSEKVPGAPAASAQFQAQTNDLGEYRLPHLPPGKYLVAVLARPWYAQAGYRYLPQKDSGPGVSSSDHFSQPLDPLLDVVYPITFFPGVTDAHAASELVLAPGDKAEAGIQLQAVPSVHVRLTNLPVDAENGINLSASQKLFGSLNAQLPVNVGQIVPGEYEMAGLPPGEVRISLMESTDRESRTRTIDANVGGAETLDGSLAEGIANVSGRVIFPAGTPLPAQSQVRIYNDDFQPPASPLQKDGTFSFAPLPAGTYTLSVDLADPNQYIAQVSAAGAKASHQEITIAGAGDVQLAVTIGQGFGQVTGVAKLDGKPSAGIMVLIVPASGQNPEDQSRLDQSDSDGTFALRQLIPGKYQLVAIEDGWDLEWRKESVLKPYLEKAQTVQVSANDQLNVAVEVQSKQ